MKILYWVLGVIVVLLIVAFLIFVVPGPQILHSIVSVPAPAAAATVSEADAHTQRFNTLVDACTKAGGVPEGNVISGEVKCLPQPAVAETQPAVTASPTAQPQLVQPLPAVSAACPTEKEFAALTGMVADIVRTEPCLFHWRGDPQQIVATHPCPTGWSCTLGSNGKNYQYNGDDKLAAMPIFAGSWRLLSQYPANDPVQNSCNFVQKVQAEGQISDPQWTVAPGNFTCP